MTAAPVNSDEDYYMDESFDEESLSEVEEEPEEDVQEESDSHSDSDVEAEFLRGNVSSTKEDQLQELTIKQFSLNSPHIPPPPHPQPHARRHQIFGKRSGGGSGFPREKMMAYNSSSEDEVQVVIRKTVAEVNQSKHHPAQTDDETLSNRTLVPNGHPEENDLVELEDDDDVEMEDEMEEEDIAYEVEYDDQDLVSEHSNDEKDDDVEVGQLKDEQQEDQNDFDSDKLKASHPQSDLVGIVDCVSEIGTYSSESDVEKYSPQNTDNEMEFAPVPTAQNKKPLHKIFPNLNRKPILPNPFKKTADIDLPTLPKLEEALNNDKVEIDVPDCMGCDTDAFNVKFLEQQMSQMSEMIMKTFRLSGGSSDNNAFEQLAIATKLMQSQRKKLSELEEEEPDSISTLESPKTPTTVRSEILANRKCRCPSITDDNEPEEDSCMMDECGQGDGLMRYPQPHQTQSSRINCRVSSVTPTSFNSDNCGYHINIRRPRSTTSSEKVK